ncbi:hypothetical protein [Lignipirellula cremea]|uniref:hypothetical protein n=1 Tax=Lignipirellula cremea TaxID=2528010 RepID=UPI00119D75A9|nr:hypothetical protein [Lignipirellula cremea]
MLRPTSERDRNHEENGDGIGHFQRDVFRQEQVLFKRAGADGKRAHPSRDGWNYHFPTGEVASYDAEQMMFTPMKTTMEP